MAKVSTRYWAPKTTTGSRPTGSSTPRSAAQRSSPSSCRCSRHVAARASSSDSTVSSRPGIKLASVPMTNAIAAPSQ
jgi:hypothetical protein